MKDWALLAYFGRLVDHPIEGFLNVSCKHFKSMLILFPTQHFISGCFLSSTTGNLHVPIFPACEATRWQSSLAAAQLLLWNSLASPWLRSRTLSPDLSGPGSPQTHVFPLAPCMRDSWCKSFSALVKKKNQSELVTPNGRDTRSLSSTHFFF